MRILFAALGVNAGCGGLERFNQRLIRTLAELSGAEVEEFRVLALRDEGGAADRRISGFARRRLAMTLAFCRALIAIRPDAILLGHVLLAPLWIPAALLRPRAPRVLLAHGIEVWGAPWRRPGKLERWLVRRLTDSVAVVSRYTARKMARVYGLEEGRFFHLPNAIDVPSAVPFGPDVRDGVRLLTIARMDKQDRLKGVGELILAMPRILRRFPEARLEIVGAGELEKEYRQLVAELKLEASVKLLGRISDEEKEDAFRRATAFVLPSRKEGFGIVFLEAWGHGLPVIGSYEDAAAELITDGLNGYLTEGDCPEAIAECVIRLHEDPARACAMGIEGRRRVLSAYSQEHFRQNLQALLRGLKASVDGAACAAHRLARRGKAKELCES